MVINYVVHVINAQKKMRQQNRAPHLKTNSKFILVQYDKNLLQSNGVSNRCEIPNDGGFGFGQIPTVGDLETKWFFTIFAPSKP